MEKSLRDALETAILFFGLGITPAAVTIERWERWIALSKSVEDEARSTED